MARTREPRRTAAHGSDSGLHRTREWTVTCCLETFFGRFPDLPANGSGSAASLLAPPAKFTEFGALLQDLIGNRGWGQASPDVWHPNDSRAWISDYQFRDVIYAYDCFGTWNPTPVTPSGGSDLVQSAKQRIYMGSSMNAAGQLL